MSKPNLPKYLPAALAELAKVKEPGLHHVTILHDDWCAMLAGKGPCNCNPVVKPAVTHAAWKRRN